MNIIIVKPSNRQNKKFVAIIDNRNIHFGQRGASDYTIHKDKERRMRYISRHAKRENQFWTHTKINLLRPSYWSRYLLWEKPSLDKSKRFIERKQNIKIKLLD